MSHKWCEPHNRTGAKNSLRSLRTRLRYRYSEDPTLPSRAEPNVTIEPVRSVCRLECLPERDYLHPRSLENEARGHRIPN